jgi:hypothetical protein
LAGVFADLLPGNSSLRIFAEFLGAAFQLGSLFRRKFVVEVAEFQINGFDQFTPFCFGHPAQFFKNFHLAHGGNLLLWFAGASRSFTAENFFILPFAFCLYPHFAMTVTELLESVRRVEVRANRLVNDTMVGA